jgi:hypothetical protein
MEDVGRMKEDGQKEGGVTRLHNSGSEKGVVLQSSG